MARVIVVGQPDERLRNILEEAGWEVQQITGRATKGPLEAAGVDDADVLLMTDPTEGTAIPVARELNPGIRVVVYASDSPPEFARHQADLILDAEGFSRTLLVEELSRTNG